MEDFPGVIIDNGSYYIKAGIGGEEGPRSVFNSYIGYTPDKYHFFIGQKAKIYNTNMNFLIEYGVVKNWEDMEKIWKYTFFDELESDPKNNNVMLTTLPNSPKEQIEKSSEIMF